MFCFVPYCPCFLTLKLHMMDVLGYNLDFFCVYFGSCGCCSGCIAVLLADCCDSLPVTGVCSHSTLNAIVFMHNVCIRAAGHCGLFSPAGKTCLDIVFSLSYSCCLDWWSVYIMIVAILYCLFIFCVIFNSCTLLANFGTCVNAFPFIIKQWIGWVNDPMTHY